MGRCWCIAATLTTTEVAASVQPLLGETDGASHTQIGWHVCRESKFLDSGGALQ